MHCSAKNLVQLGLKGNDLWDIPPCFANLTKLSNQGILKVTDMFEDCSNIRPVHTDMYCDFRQIVKFPSTSVFYG